VRHDDAPTVRIVRCATIGPPARARLGWGQTLQNSWNASVSGTSGTLTATPNGNGNGNSFGITVYKNGNTATPTATCTAT